MQLKLKRCKNMKNKNNVMSVEKLEERAVFHAGDICVLPVPFGPIDGMVDDAGVSNAIPALSSNPSSNNKVYLDFDGNFLTQWGAWSNVSTPPFSNPSAIPEIWARMVEDFSIFDVDVTTVEPVQGNKVNKIVVGGSSYDWYGYSAGGVAYEGGFFGGFVPTVGFVFSETLGNNTKNIAEAGSHEAGHIFGLSHQSLWSNGTKVSEYYSGFGDWAPIMGNSYSAARSTWHNGNPDWSGTETQNDITIIGRLGFRTDDFPSENNVVTPNFNINGILGVNDTDVFQFTTSGGLVNINLNAVQYNNTNLKLQIKDSNNNVLFENSPTNSYNANLSVTLAAGTYKIVAMTTGEYGNVGQYNLSGTFNQDTVGPPFMFVDIGDEFVDSGATLDFGTVNQSTVVEKVIDINNAGEGNLNITSINVPAGFVIVGTPPTVVMPESTANIIVRMNTLNGGTNSGQLVINSNDTINPNFVINLTGSVLAPKINLNVTQNSTTDFGVVNKGQTPVDKTFVVTNNGNAPLVLNSVNVPNGYTIIVPPAGTVQPGQNTSFTVRLNTSVEGTYSGAVNVSSNDAVTPNYTFNVTGSIVYAKINVNPTSVAFGNVQFNSSTTKDVVVTNQGTANLIISTTISGAGFTVVNPANNLSVAPGSSVTLQVNLDGSVAGTKTGQLVITSNDSSNATVTVNLTGNVLQLNVNRVIDNGDSGFNKSSGWVTIPKYGFQNDSSLSWGTSANATWTFNSVPNGTYNVYATWKTLPILSLSTSVTYNINGTNNVINQRIKPNSLVEDGVDWGLIGTVTVTNGTITIKLTNNTSGWMEADAIKIKSV
jgi:hypothetical protein